MILFTFVDDTHPNFQPLPRMTEVTHAAMSELRRRMRAAGAAPHLARSEAFCRGFDATTGRAWTDRNMRKYAAFKTVVTPVMLPFAALRGLYLSGRADAPLPLATIRCIVEASEAPDGAWVDGDGHVFDVTGGVAHLAADDAARVRVVRALVARSFFCSRPMVDGRVVWADAAAEMCDLPAVRRRVAWAPALRRVSPLECMLEHAVAHRVPLLPLLPNMLSRGARARTTVLTLPVRHGAHYMLVVYFTQTNAVHFFDPRPNQHRFDSLVRPLLAAMCAPPLALLPADARLPQWDAARERTGAGDAGFYVARLARRLHYWTRFGDYRRRFGGAPVLSPADAQGLMAAAVAATHDLFAGDEMAAANTRRLACAAWEGRVVAGAPAHASWAIEAEPE